jgi:Domain of unknown function (DUF4411)
MSYAFDNSPLSTLFRNYYPARFPSLWERFNSLVEAGDLLSTREVRHEIEDGPLENLRQWATDNEPIFATPTATEGTFVAGIFAIQHFQQNIERQKILRGGRNADPFIIARAAVAECPLVTMEQFKDNAAKIPNICRHFDIECISLEEFMEREGWQF